MTKNSQDFNTYYCQENSTDGYGVIDSTTPEFLPFLEAEGVSGRGASREVVNVKRLGTRKRAGRPRGKRDEPQLKIDVTLTEAQTITNKVGGTPFTSLSTYNVDTLTAFGIGNLTTGNEGLIFDHTYNKSTLNGLSPASFTIVVMDDGTTQTSTPSVVEVYYGCVLSEINVSIGEGEVVKVSLTFDRQYSKFYLTLAAAGLSTAEFGSYPTSLDYIMWSDVYIYKTLTGSSWQGSDASDTVELANVSSFDVTVSQSAEKKFRISGQDTPEGIELLAFEVKGSMDMDYDDTEQLDEIQDAITGEGIITVTLGSTFTITLQGTVFEGFPMDASPDQLLTAGVDYSSDTIVFA